MYKLWSILTWWSGSTVKYEEPKIGKSEFKSTQSWLFSTIQVYISYNLDLYGKRKNCVNYEESKARESRCGSTRIQLKSCDCFYPGSFVSDFDKWIINYEESNVGGL